MDKQKQQPTGFALGSIEGRVAIQYFQATSPRDNFTFKCHRSAQPVNGYVEIFAVSATNRFLFSKDHFFQSLLELFVFSVELIVVVI